MEWSTTIRARGTRDQLAGTPRMERSRRTQSPSVPVRQRAELALHTARPRPSSTSTTPAVEFRDDQLNLEVEPAARLENGLHLEALVTDEAANVLPASAVTTGSAIHDHADACAGQRRSRRDALTPLLQQGPIFRRRPRQPRRWRSPAPFRLPPGMKGELPTTCSLPSEIGSDTARARGCPRCAWLPRKASLERRRAAYGEDLD
jgi:hypothetical protein